MRMYACTPQDVLFLRDARPMDGSDVGRGANWPRPDQIWNALINAFHAAWPERQDWEGAPHTKNAKDKPHSSDRFGALKSIGPFPFSEENGGVWLPCPADWGMKLVAMEKGTTDMPQPLHYAFLPEKKGKTANPRWMDAASYSAYLAGKAADIHNKDDALYAAERSIGIAVDPVTGNAADGKLYQAEYLRLHPGVTLAFFASCRIRRRGSETLTDAFTARGAPERLVFGGQRGVAGIAPVDGTRFPFAEHMPAFSGRGAVLLRWTLLSPAVFVNGWLPGWVQADGLVRLPRGKAERGKYSGKEARRKALEDIGFVEARLVAARVGKPLAFSGWRLGTGDSGDPKPTLLAVPAGSCYVFECADAEEAAALARVLSFPNPRSDRFGEKGFGIGVCSQMIQENTEGEKAQ